ncbi:MAG: hypothetical protein J7L98_04615 [Candidatus Verstraetearchaeota archaeon]|nr:hypothetical protein [Candidatus Verstraetearchaeota archaeon]
MAAKKPASNLAKAEHELLVLLSHQLHPVEVHFLARLLSRRFSSSEVMQALESLKSKGLVVEGPSGYVRTASFFDQRLVEELKRLSRRRSSSS